MANFVNLCDYIDSLDIIDKIPSEIRARCPVCGVGKLKISTKKGAGVCVTNRCDINDILAAIGAPTTSRRSVGLQYVKPVKFPSEKISLISSESYTSLAVHEPSRFCHKFGEKIQCTNYYYDDHHKIYRVNMLVSKEKNVFPNVYDTNENRWKISTEGFVFFNEWELKKRGDLKKIVIIVEGEKVADIISNVSNYLCITPPLGFGWSANWLPDAIRRISKYVAGFIVVPDNDEAGIKKAQYFEYVSYSCLMPCKIIDLRMLYKNKGDDLVDLYERGYDINSVIKWGLNTNE